MTTEIKENILNYRQRLDRTREVRRTLARLGLPCEHFVPLVSNHAEFMEAMTALVSCPPED